MDRQKTHIRLAQPKVSVISVGPVRLQVTTITYLSSPAQPLHQSPSLSFSGTFRAQWTYSRCLVHTITATDHEPAAAADDNIIDDDHHYNYHNKNENDNYMSLSSTSQLGVGDILCTVNRKSHLRAKLVSQTFIKSLFTTKRNWPFGKTKLNKPGVKKWEKQSPRHQVKHKS